MSGSGVQWNSIDNDLTSYSNLVSRLGCKGNETDYGRMNETETDLVVECLRKLDASLLVNEFNALRGFEDNGSRLFSETSFIKNILIENQVYRSHDQ